MKRICKVFSVLLIVFLLAAVAALVLPRLFGVKMFSVLSGSMEPTYSTGDLIYAFPEEAEKIEVDDVITFVLNNEGTIATHRVVEVDRENKQLYTKGDANAASDGRPVKYENVLGVVRFGIPKVGYLIGYMNTLPGKIVTITIIIAIIILITLLQSQIGDGEYEEESEEERPVRRQWDVEHRRKKEVVEKRKKEEEIERPEKWGLPNPRPARQSIKEHIMAREEKHSRRSNRSANQDPVKQSLKEHVIEKEKMPPIVEIPLRTKVSEHHITESDYKYQRLQVCYKMITLMETMWNDTMADEKEVLQEEKPDIIDTFEEIDDFEEGGYEVDEEESRYTVS